MGGQCLCAAWGFEFWLFSSEGVPMSSLVRVFKAEIVVCSFHFLLRNPAIPSQVESGVLWLLLKQVVNPVALF
jgi:hypothetical protein